MNLLLEERCLKQMLLVRTDFSVFQICSLINYELLLVKPMNIKGTEYTNMNIQGMNIHFLARNKAEADFLSKQLHFNVFCGNISICCNCLELVASVFRILFCS